MKYIVVHSGARDRYEVAIALHKQGKLGFLVTDDILFRKEWRNIFPWKCIRIPLIAFFFRVLYLLFPNQSWIHIYKDRSLGRTAGKLSKKYNMRLLALSEYAFPAYRYSNIRPRIVFQFHPYALSNKKIFEEEILRHPEIAENLSKEMEMSIPPGRLIELKSEVENTDFYIAASSYTKESLMMAGVPETNIFITPYGVDTKLYPFKKREIPSRINFVYVGSYTERKGIYYLLSAAKKLQDEGYDFQLNMTGRTSRSIEEFKKYGVKNLNMYSNLSHEQLIDLLHNSDVFVFPSLCEGFAFVVIEAMSTGLPVIATSRTAGKDILEDGKDGFVIEPSSVDAVYEKMKYFINNPAETCRMGINAAKKSKTITWDNFEKGIQNAIQIIENKVDK